MRRIAVFSFVAIAAAMAGCSKSSDTPSAEQAAAAPAPQQVEPPDVAVRQFLEAIRVGNHKLAENMLTDLAKQKTSEADLMVAPPGSPTATFQIAGMEVIDNQVAHVGTVWTDIGDDGKPQSNEFVWALRLEPTGWRIAGVAVELFPGQPPLLLDFEDPADMLRKQQMAEAEAQRRMNPTAQQAGGPGVTAAAGPNGVVPAAGTAPINGQPSQPAGIPATAGEPGLLQGAGQQPGQFQR